MKPNPSGTSESPSWGISQRKRYRNDSLFFGGYWFYNVSLIFI
jgi:hypothetical protein